MLMRKVLFAGAAVSSLAFACNAAAQASGSTAAPQASGAAATPQAATGDAAADIVVTALKRSESLQNVPATITAASGATLQAQNVTSALGLPSVIPGLQIQLSPSNRPVALIHGLGSNPAVASFDQSVSLFVDGVFEGHGKAYSMPLFDINDVEAVKGTQSALLGKNTSVGAVAVTTQKPIFKFGMGLSYSHEFELNQNLVEGFLNIPLSDRLAVRIAGQYNQRDGWLHNELDGQDGPETDNKAGRISLLWAPSDRAEWTVSYEHAHLKQDGPVFFMGADALGIAQGWAAQLGDPNFTVGYDRTSQSGRPGLPAPNEVSNLDRVNSTLTYDLNGYNLTFLSGYYRLDTATVNNSNALPDSPLRTEEREFNETFSQEIRMSSPKIGRMDYVLGALFMHDRWSRDLNTDVIAPIPLTGDSDNHYVQRAVTGSVFGQLNYGITERLSASVGMRGTREEKKASFARSVLRPGPIALIYPALAPVSLSRTEWDYDGSVGLKYKLDSRSMFYASYSKGTKGGGFQDTPTTIAEAPYKAEVSWSAEAGAKLSFGRRGHLNVALFNTDVNNFQLGSFNGAKFIVDNIDLNSRGVDVDVSWSPIDGLVAGVSGTYADTKNKHPVGAPKFYGSTVPYAPKWSGTVSLGYSHPLNDDYTFKADASVDFRSDIALVIASNTIVPRSPSYSKVNLRVAISRPKDGLEIAFVGRNLNNERSATFGFQTFPNVPGSYVLSSDEPRTLAVQVSFKY
jgi:iron complex outermembrane receptor protein